MYLWIDLLEKRYSWENQMPSLGFIMAIIGASVGMLIGILIFSEVSAILDCTTVEHEAFKQECENAKDVGWTVIAILPIALFFAIFAIFGGLQFEIAKLKGANETLMALYHSRPSTTIIEKHHPPKRYPPPFPMWPNKYQSYESKLWR